LQAHQLEYNEAPWWLLLEVPFHRSAVTFLNKKGGSRRNIIGVMVQGLRLGWGQVDALIVDSFSKSN
jgi:hypothetical protein